MSTIQFRAKKDAITDKAKDRHDAYLSVWWELMKLQQGRAGQHKIFQPQRIVPAGPHYAENYGEDEK